MKTIGITDFKKIVMERLANPSLFVGRSLLLWNEIHIDHNSISYNVIEQCCIEHNIANPDQQVWISLSDFCFYSDDITKISAFCEKKDMYGFKNSGILYNTGCFLVDDLDNWIEFINTHENQIGHLSEKWPLIACIMANDAHYNITEDAFSNYCDIYELKPTIGEWSQWLSDKQWCNKNVLSSVLKYINKNGMRIHLNWWNFIIATASWLMNKNACKTVADIPKGKLESELFGVMMSDINGRVLDLEEKRNIWKLLRSNS